MVPNKNTTAVPAFTLIEVLITVTLLGILSTVMLVSFGSGRINQELEGAAREVAGAFREAQNYALTGHQGVSGTDPCRFTVSWGGTSYSTTYFYKDGSGNCTQFSVIRSYVLRNGVVFGSSGSYYFTLPHATVSFVGANLPVSVTKAGVSYVVCSYASGLINHYTGSSCP